MRKILIVISLTIVFISCCTKVSYEDVISVESPNWTSDGKVVFIREKEVWKTVEDIGVRSDIVSDSTWLYEINADGSGRENKGLLFEDAEFGGGGLSSVGDWVVFGDADNNIWVVRRDGTGLQEVGEGRYPDFSPDASQIVYEKTNNGIWIMDRDGGNDRQIISDVDATQPVWNSEGNAIAFTTTGGGQGGALIVGDTIGNILINSSDFGYGLGFYTLDWAPPDTNALISAYYGQPTIVYLLNDSIGSRTVPNGGGYNWGWSPDGSWLCSETSQGILVIKVNGTEGHYITP
jgi:Tol biopolymer transport system component